MTEPFKLFKEDKEKGLFIKTCVLPCSNDENQIKDCREQTYTKEDIAILISTEANNCHFDHNHDQKRLNHIHTLQNYQTRTEETIGDIKIPIGSWIKIIFSQNKYINQRILNGEIRGVSSDFTINTDKEYCKCNKQLTPGINTFTYNDVPEKECIIQTHLSFVDYPCNNMPIEAQTYSEYKINNYGDDKLTLKDEIKKIFNKKEEPEYVIENSEDMVRVINEITTDKLASFKEEIGQLFDLISQDIELIQADFQGVQESVTKLMGEGEDPAAADGEKPPEDKAAAGEGIQNKEDPIEEPSVEDETTAKLDKIMNRLDTLEGKVEEAQKKPVIKNQAFIKNLDKKEGTKTFLNRGK